MSSSSSSPADTDAEPEMPHFERFLSRKQRDLGEGEVRWAAFERARREAIQRDAEWKAYWKRRQDDDRDLWRDKDFANAVDKMSRAGYKGEHGEFDVADEEMVKFDALFMQVTVGDFDGNEGLRCAEAWRQLKGMSRVEAQREAIKLTNRVLTRVGWNPPPGWV